MDEQLREMINLAKEYYRRGDYDKARPLFEDVITRNLAFADVYNMLGVIYHQGGEFGRAQSILEKAIEINPAYTEASLNLAVLYNDIGEYEKAKAIYNAALKQSRREGGEMDPYFKGKIANMYADIADAYRSAGFLRKAVEEYRRALEVRPLFVDIRTKLASALRDLGDIDNAIGELNRSLRDRPNHVPALNLLGVCYYMSANVSKAVEYWKEALRIDPNNSVSSMYLKMVSSDTPKQ
jgi:tetratricopeptide (TPR) repeat protein